MRVFVGAQGICFFCRIASYADGSRMFTDAPESTKMRTGTPAIGILAIGCCLGDVVVVPSTVKTNSSSSLSLNDTHDCVFGEHWNQENPLH